jgi:hypothetical protein
MGANLVRLLLIVLFLVTAVARLTLLACVGRATEEKRTLSIEASPDPTLQQRREYLADHLFFTSLCRRKCQSCIR